MDLVFAGKRLHLETKIYPEYRREDRSDEPSSDAGSLLGGRAGGTFIVPCSAEHRPETMSGPNRDEPVAVALANILVANDREGAILDFVKRWGLPDHHETTIDWFEATAEQICWRAYVARRGGLESLYQEFESLPPLKACVVDHTIVSRARHLADFMWAEFIALVEESREFRHCDFCSKLFVTCERPETRRHPSRFCPRPKDKCRNAFAKSKEGQARQAELEAIQKSIAAQEDEALIGQGYDPVSWRRAGRLTSARRG